MQKNLIKIQIILLIIFSFTVNFYYGSLGVLTTDTFSHFDSTYKLLEGIVIFRDFWNVSGAIIDYIQLPFFYFFGANWTSYILQSSIFNCCITICTFFFFKNLNLSNFFSFFYSLCFSLLANPSMGTPFIDHYSTFFSLLGFYCFFFAIKKEKNFYWFLLPILFFIAFFSKQTPSSYIIFIIIVMTLFYLIIFKKFYLIKPLILGISLSLSIFIVFLFTNEIEIQDFITQYILFPQTIGSTRFNEFKLNFNNVIFNFKFIHIFILTLIFITFKNLNLNSEKNKKVIITNLTLVLFSILLIFHQIYTKNFIFIFFLIPLLGGVIHSQVMSYFHNRKSFLIILVALIIFTSIKYHQRFNVERKMLNLQNVNLKMAIDAKKIDKKLSGLKWITYGTLEPSEEIELIKESLRIIGDDKQEIMFLSHYNFFSTILEKTLYSPSRWPTDLVSNPDKQNKFYKNYVSFTKNLILKKNIKSIYISLPSSQIEISDLVPENCTVKTKKNKILLHFQIINNC